MLHRPPTTTNTSLHCTAKRKENNHQLKPPNPLIPIFSFSLRSAKASPEHHRNILQAMERLTYFSPSPNTFPSSLIPLSLLLSRSYQAELITLLAADGDFRVIVAASLPTRNMTLIKAKRWHTCWSITSIRRRHAVAVVFDCDFTLHFHPLAGIARSIKGLNGTRADEELRVLLTRCVRDEPLNAAQWKTIRLRDWIIICVGNRGEEIPYWFDNILLLDRQRWRATKREMALPKFNSTHRCDSLLCAELDQPRCQTPNRICWIYKYSAGIQP